MMGWPQITLLILMGARLGVDVINHGKDVKVKGWVAIVRFGILLGLLIAGGFFS